MWDLTWTVQTKTKVCQSIDGVTESWNGLGPWLIPWCCHVPRQSTLGSSASAHGSPQEAVLVLLYLLQH